MKIKGHGSKLPLLNYADVRNVDDASHSLWKTHPFRTSSRTRKILPGHLEAKALSVQRCCRFVAESTTRTCCCQQWCWC